MKLMDLVDKLCVMHKEHGNIDVKIECLPLDKVEFVHAIDGEHKAFVDLVSDVDE